MKSRLDVIIVGGGPAGLSAALVLARCTRTVLVFDANRGRNRASRRLNGFLTRDGVSPARFRELSAAEVRGYGVSVLRTGVVAARRTGSGAFVVTDRRGRKFTSRKLLLATGVIDLVPAIPGLRSLYGASVHHCPYCDGWSYRDKRLAAVGNGPAALGLALALRTWTPNVVACTQGERLSRRDMQRAEHNGIVVRTPRVTRIEGRRGELRFIRFDDGHRAACDGLFFNTGQVQRSALPKRLGCAFREDGAVVTDQRQCTGVPGLYLAGDADKDVQFAIVAAAEGAVAATAINRELQDEDRGEPRRAPPRELLSVKPFRRSSQTRA